MSREFPSSCVGIKRARAFTVIKMSSVRYSMTSPKACLKNAELLLLTGVPFEEFQNTMCIIGTCDRSMTDEFA